MMKLFAAFAFVSLLASPALADPTCNRLAVALVIDRSGSMMGQPMDNAKLGAAAAVDRLSASDCVTVIAFDSQPTVIVPLHALNDAANVKTAITRIQAGGGTEILSALDAAHKAILGATNARRKHVVLLTDGQSPIAGLQALATTMNNEHMTLSTIGFGSSTDEQTLRMLSTTASGRFYKVADATMLPRIFSREIDLALAP